MPLSWRVNLLPLSGTVTIDIWHKTIFLVQLKLFHQLMVFSVGIVSFINALV
jgi:hypothetical protein